MKKIIPILALCWLAAQANAVEWLTDLPKALAQAKADKKMVFMDFTGSDWCPPCKALHKKVLTSKVFEGYAKKNLVLVVVDFPHSNSKTLFKGQTEELKKANEALAKKYGIDGFPTVIVLDGDGNQLSKEVGYDDQKPNYFIEKLQKLKKTS